MSHPRFPFKLVRGFVLMNPDGSRSGDGDSIRVTSPVVYDVNDRRVDFDFHLSRTTLSLPVRLLGIDTPEETYTGSTIPGCSMPNLYRFGGSVPQQEPWGLRSKAFTDGFLKPGEPVTIELDDRVFDRNQRLLGFAYRGEHVHPEQSLNLQIIRAGWAMLYQIHPNLGHVEEYREAVSEAIREQRGLWPDVEDSRPLTVDEVERQTALNPPFVYRKVIDSFIAGVPTTLAFRRAGRWCGDSETKLVYPPERWYAVPHPNRLFFERRQDAEQLGYTAAPPVRGPRLRLRTTAPAI